MQFERDPRKAATNLRKHGVSFEEASTVFVREDFGPMERGKYAARVRESSNVVVLDPDVAQAFPNAQAVNDALRSLIELARASAGLSLQSPQSESHAASRHVNVPNL